MARRFEGKPETSYQRSARLHPPRLSPETVAEGNAKISEIRSTLAVQHDSVGYPTVAGRQAIRALQEEETSLRRLKVDQELAVVAAKKIVLRDSSTGRVILGCMSFQSEWLDLADGSPELYYVGPDLEHLSDRIGDQTEV